MGRNRNRGTKKPHPVGGVKRGSAGGGAVVLGKKMLGRKREVDIQKQDPKLQEQVAVKITRDARLDALGLKMSGSGGNTQRKKAPVLKPRAARTGTIYKAKQRVSTRTATNPHSQKPPTVPVLYQKSPQKRTVSVPKRGSTQKSGMAPLKKVLVQKTSPPALRKKDKILKKKPAPKGRQNIIVNGHASMDKTNQKPGRPNVKRRKRGTALAGGASGAKKFKLSIPAGQFLLTLVRDFDITLRRDTTIEERAAALKHVKPILPVLNASLKSGDQSHVPGTSSHAQSERSDDTEVLVSEPADGAEVGNLTSDMGVDMISLLQECENADEVEWVPSTPGGSGVDMDLDSFQEEAEVVSEADSDVIPLLTPPTPASNVVQTENLENRVQKPLELDDDLSGDSDVEFVDEGEVKDPLDISDQVAHDVDLEETEEEVDNENPDGVYDNDEEEEEEIEEIETLRVNATNNPPMPPISINYGGNAIRNALAAKQKSSSNGSH